MLCRDVDFPSIVVAVLDAMCAMSRISSRGKRSSRADPFASAVATHGMHLVVSCVLSRRDSLRAHTHNVSLCRDSRITTQDAAGDGPGAETREA